MDSVYNLIKEYVNITNNFSTELKQHYGVDNLLSGWRQKIVPQSGEISEKEISFYFHGVGCCIEKKDVSVDFDFGPNGRVDGFDLWRLQKYLSNNSVKKRYSSFTDNETLKREFVKLADDKKISCPKWQPNTGLYYLNEVL